jgi:hypothetical protein
MAPMTSTDGYYLIGFAALAALGLFANWKSGKALTGGPLFWIVGYVPRSERPVHYWIIQAVLVGLCVVSLAGGIYLLGNR